MKHSVHCISRQGAAGAQRGMKTSERAAIEQRQQPTKQYHRLPVIQLPLCASTVRIELCRTDKLSTYNVANKLLLQFFSSNFFF